MCNVVSDSHYYKYSGNIAVIVEDELEKEVETLLFYSKEALETHSNFCIGYSGYHPRVPEQQSTIYGICEALMYNRASIFRTMLLGLSQNYRCATQWM